MIFRSFYPIISVLLFLVLVFASFTSYSEPEPEQEPKYDFTVLPEDDQEDKAPETTTVATTVAMTIATPIVTGQPTEQATTKNSTWISAVEKQSDHDNRTTDNRNNVNPNDNPNPNNTNLNPNNNSGLYTIKDLEILEKEKDYQEFFQHARDIRPADRDQQWKSMVNYMAESYLHDQIKKKNLQESSINFINSLAEWPLLQENLFFIRGRLKLGVQYFQKCFTTNNLNSNNNLNKDKNVECLNTMYTFWQNYPQDPELGIEFGKLAHIYDPVSTIDHWAFLRSASISDNSEIFCKNPTVKYYLLKELYQEATKEDNEEKLSRKIKTLLNKMCWQQIKEEISSMLFDQSVGTSKQLFAYRMLLTFKDLDSQKIELFPIVYVLYGPLNDKIFNQAWNNITQLGKNYAKREKLLSMIKNIDPLPGKLFSILNNKRKEVITDHLYTNFPEYFDYYALTCINYLSGKNIYKNGNPTPNCRDFFKAATNKNWPNLSLKEKYQKISRL